MINHCWAARKSSNVCSIRKYQCLYKTSQQLNQAQLSCSTSCASSMREARSEAILALFLSSMLSAISPSSSSSWSSMVWEPTCWTQVCPQSSSPAELPYPSVNSLKPKQKLVQIESTKGVCITGLLPCPEYLPGSRRDHRWGTDRRRLAHWPPHTCMPAAWLSRPPPGASSWRHFLGPGIYQWCWQ